MLHVFKIVSSTYHQHNPKVLAILWTCCFFCDHYFHVPNCDALWFTALTDKLIDIFCVFFILNCSAMFLYSTLRIIGPSNIEVMPFVGILII